MELNNLDKMIIICENSYKEYILKNINGFLDVKFYSKKEFLSEYLFSYSPEALCYIIKKYHVKVNIAKMYLSNLYVIEDKKYINKKLTFLKELKEDLTKEGLLIYNPYFKNYIQNKKIIVIGYSYLEKWERNIFNKLNAIIYKDVAKYSLKEVYEFKKMEEEVEFVFDKIAQLIDNNIKIEHIKIAGVSNEYYNTLERYAKFYKIPLNIPNKTSLYSTKVAQVFLNNLNTSLEDAIKTINIYDEDVINKIITICNKYINIKDEGILKECLVEEFKNTYIDNVNKNAINITHLFDYISDDDYVFLLNFNMGLIPSYKDNEEYLNDYLCREVEIDYVIDKNKEIKTTTINRLQSIKNLVITYKLSDSKNIYFPSSLVNTLNLTVKKYEKNLDISYSKLSDLIKYTKLKDEYEKYHKIDPLLYLYENSLNTKDYKTYDNRYTKISKNNLKDYLKDGLTLSYSSLNNYNKCAFRFYLSNILKVDSNSSSFDTFIGSLFHDVLEKCLKVDKNIDMEVAHFLEKEGITLNKKEEFYLTKIKKDMEFVINAIRDEQKYISLDNEYHEKYIMINKDREIPVKLVGIVDRILYKQVSGKEIVAIIDYKTGNTKSEINYVPYGLSLQLPIYLYLVSKANIFASPSFAGFYLKNILDKDILRTDKKIEDALRDNLKLKGFSNSDMRILKYLDNTLENSLLIKGLKVKADGSFYESAKVLSDEEMAKLVSITEGVIEENITNILNADFSINPKKIGYDNDVGCTYCKFKDICFKTAKDYVILKDLKASEFLRSEDYAKVD